MSNGIACAIGCKRFAARFAGRQFRVLRKLRDLRQEIGRHFSREAVIEQLRFVGIFRAPRIVGFFPAIILSKQRLFVLGEIVVTFLRDKIMLVRQAERLAGCIDKFRACFAVCLVCARDFGNAFSDQRMRDDELRFPVVAAFRDVERVEKLPHVLAVDFLDIKAVRLETRRRVLALRRLAGASSVTALES